MMVSKPKGHVTQCDALTVQLLNKLWDDQSYHKLNTVKRNLFGYYESKEIYQLLDKQVSNMAEKSQEEWNFDFIKESPKPGRYLWQKVSSCDVPLWYSTINRPALKDILSKSAHIEKNSCIESNCYFVERETKSPLSKNKENDMKNDQPAKKKLRQTTMKDYTRVKKRRSSCRLRLKQLEIFSQRLRSHPVMSDRRAS